MPLSRRKTSIHGGEAGNVIPESVQLKGTLRSLTSAGLKSLQQRLTEIATSVATAHRCRADVQFVGHDYPALVNDPGCWELARRVAGSMLNPQNVHEAPPVMGGEDFAYYTDRIRGCFMALGVRNDAEGATFGLHHPRFKVDEQALPIGAALHVLLATTALDQLREKSVVRSP